jgi:hypothetical protein
VVFAQETGQELKYKWKRNINCLGKHVHNKASFGSILLEDGVRKLDNFRYILIPEIINMFMTNISDPVRAKHVLVFKLNLK